MKRVDGDERKVAVGLVRCSTDMQEHSIEDQEAEIRAWAEETDHKLLQIFRDEGVSGSELDRPGIRALLAFMESWPESGVLVAWKRNRLARPDDPREGIALELKIEQLGWRLHFLQGSGSSGNPLVDSILSLLEHHEGGQYLRNLATDTLRGQVRRILDGEVHGGKIPYGYAKVIIGEDGEERRIARKQKHRKLREERTKWVLGDPGEIRVVRWIFERYTTGLLGFAQLAKELNEQKVLSPSGRKWCGGTIRDMLLNPVYAGEMIWNRETSSKFCRLLGGKPTKQKKARLSGVRTPHEARRKTTYERNDPSEWIRIENHHEPIVEHAVFARAGEIIRERGKKQGKNKTVRVAYPLSGFVVCAGCGRNMTGRKGYRATSGYQCRRYYCTSQNMNRSCAPNAVDADRLEQVVLRKLKEIYAPQGGVDTELREDIVAVLCRRLADENPLIDHDALRRERKELAGQIQTGIDNLGRVGPDIAPMLAEQIRGWQTRQEEIARELGREEGRKAKVVEIEKAADEVLGLLNQLDRVGADSSHEELRQLFDGTIEAIEMRFKTYPPLPGRKRPRHVFQGATLYVCGILEAAREAMRPDEAPPGELRQAPPRWRKPRTSNQPRPKVGAEAQVCTWESSSGWIRTSSQVVNSHLLYH